MTLLHFSLNVLHLTIVNIIHVYYMSMHTCVYVVYHFEVFSSDNNEICKDEINSIT